MNGEGGQKKQGDCQELAFKGASNRVRQQKRKMPKKGGFSV
jgi:hypothetical protein